MIKIRILFCLMILDNTFTDASVVRFEATPSELKTNLTDVASLRCSVTGAGVRSSSGRVHRVMSIFITRADGQDVASVTGTDAPAAFVDPGNLQVSGSISGVSGDGFIELTWSNPTEMTLGEYTCDVTARDERGHTLVLTSSLELMASDPSIADVVNFFKEKTLKIELENQSQKQTIALQQQQITKLKQCSSRHVGFTAGFKANVQNIAQGAVAKFDNVLMNVGGAYDGSTGTFTCPVAGMYSFHINIMAYTTHHACLHLQVNGSAVSTAFAEGDDFNTGSTSVVLDLKQGDVVTALGCDYGSGYANMQVDSYGTSARNIFTGHLVNAADCYI